MSALQELADEVGGLVGGFGQSQQRAAFLSADVDASTLTWQVDATSNLGEGVVEIEDEVVYVQRYNGNDSSLLLSPDGRGYDGSDAAAHAAGTRIRIQPTFPRTAIKRAINTAIGRCFPLVWGTEVVNLTYTPPTSTYELPEGTTKILGVDYDTYGPTGEWPQSHWWSFDGTADTTTYPSGKTITLGMGLTPGREFRVTVAKAPTPLVNADANFSATGLSDTAKHAVVLGAASHLLRFTEPVRLATSAASADEYDSKKPYLTGTKLANDLEQQFQIELRNEATRLSQTFPPRIHRRN